MTNACGSHTNESQESRQQSQIHEVLSSHEMAMTLVMLPPTHSTPVCAGTVK